MASYSMTPSGENCYPGTTVLINKLDLRDQKLLDQAEEMAASVAFVHIYNRADKDKFTLEYYKSLHREMFGKLYDWAGELRTVNLTKKGTVFCPAKELQTVGTAIFARIAALNEFRNLPRKQFVEQITELYHDLNMLHPFREGNGRTERLFFTLLIERAGYRIDFSAHDPDELIVGTIYAAQGIMDHLKRYFDKAIEQDP